MIIPNAFAIVNYLPSNVFCLQQDFLAVSTAYNCILADLDIVSYQSTCDDGTVFYNNTGHQDGVNDLGTLADFRACKDNGVFYFTFDYAALGNVSNINGGIGADISG